MAFNFHLNFISLFPFNQLYISSCLTLCIPKYHQQVLLLLLLLLLPLYSQCMTPIILGNKNMTQYYNNIIMSIYWIIPYHLILLVK